eukprot:scaffold9422_cov31-Tisochrysis_lutea.AAC.3
MRKRGMLQARFLFAKVIGGGHDRSLALRDSPKSGTYWGCCALMTIVAAAVPGRNPISASMNTPLSVFTEKYTMSAPSGNLRLAMKKTDAASSLAQTASTLAWAPCSPCTSTRCSWPIPFHCSRKAPRSSRPSAARTARRSQLSWK